MPEMEESYHQAEACLTLIREARRTNRAGDAAATDQLLEALETMAADLTGKQANYMSRFRSGATTIITSLASVLASIALVADAVLTHTANRV